MWVWVALFCLVASLLGMAEAVVAQAGSTGGTLGKTDQSLSGGSKEAPASKPSTDSRKAKGKDTATGCSAAIGGAWTSNFSGTFGEQDVLVSANHSYRHKTGLVTGSWSCQSGVFTFTATNGDMERVRLSSDGKRLVKPDGATWLRR